jgi:hypothetical protein
MVVLLVLSLFYIKNGWWKDKTHPKTHVCEWDASGVVVLDTHRKGGGGEVVSRGSPTWSKSNIYKQKTYLSLRRGSRGSRSCCSCSHSCCRHCYSSPYSGAVMVVVVVQVTWRDGEMAVAISVRSSMIVRYGTHDVALLPRRRHVKWRWEVVVGCYGGGGVGIT